MQIGSVFNGVLVICGCFSVRGGVLVSTKAIELPLFPLNVVLFPGTVRPLHIFESRYRQMIKDCLYQCTPFGVVLVREESDYLSEEPYSVGTMAEIHNLSRLENGSYSLLAIGTQRFRILSQHRNRPYLSGLVEPFDDRPEPISQLSLHAEQVRRLFISYLNMLLDVPGDKDLETNLPETPEDLSHVIAYFLDVEDAEKQHYLELTSTRERLQNEIIFLRREVPFMRHMLLKEPPKERIILN
jgi:Lon protease-like protein